MARLLSINDIINSTHGMGYQESLWPTAGQSWKEAESYIEECVWLHGDIYTDYGRMMAEDDKSYNGYFIPTDADIEDEANDDLTICVGYRIWDSEPTHEEMKSTPWKKYKH